MIGSFEVKFKDDELRKKLDNADDGARRFIRATMEFHARSVQAYARRNAKWTDRTSNARNGLIAFTEEHGRLWRIVITHSVSYGIWLEIRWGGRYSIIRPSVQHEGPLVMRTVTNGFYKGVF